MHFKPVIVKVSIDSSPEQRLELETAAHQLMRNYSIVQNLVNPNADLVDQDIMLCHPHIYREMRKKLDECLMAIVMGPSIPFIEKLTKFIQTLNELENGKGTARS